MTNKEAIASLKTLCHTCKLFPQCAYKKPECFKAIELAISALEKQNAPDTNVGSMIYRQVAIDALREITFSHWFECGEYIGEDQRKMQIINAKKALETISALSSAQPVLTCDGCKHIGTYDTNFPCNGCVRREKDYYEPE